MMSTFSAYMNYCKKINTLIQTLSSVCLHVNGAKHIDTSRHWLSLGHKTVFLPWMSNGMWRTVWCRCRSKLLAVPRTIQCNCQQAWVYMKVSRTIFDDTVLVRLVRMCCYQHKFQTTVACSSTEINGSGVYSLLLFSQNSKRNMSQNGFSFLSKKCQTSYMCVHVVSLYILAIVWIVFEAASNW